jgi:hypothetical protein
MFGTILLSLLCSLASVYIFAILSKPPQPEPALTPLQAPKGAAPILPHPSQKLTLPRFPLFFDVENPGAPEMVVFLPWDEQYPVIFPLRDVLGAPHCPPELTSYLRRLLLNGYCLTGWNPCNDIEALHRLGIATREPAFYADRSVLGSNSASLTGPSLKLQAQVHGIPPPSPHAVSEVCTMSRLYSKVVLLADTP